MLLKNMQIVPLVNGSGCLVIQNGPNLSAKLNLMCKMSKHGYELKLSIAKGFIKNMAYSLCNTVLSLISSKT
jgi:hypothetical protein